MSKLVRFVIGPVLLVPSLLLVAGCGGTPSSASSTGKVGGGSSAANRGPTKTPEFKTTAAAFSKEIFDNDKAATEKYGGKVIELEGEINSANKVVSERAVSLVGGKKDAKDVVGLMIFCTPVAEEMDKVWWLGKGQKVKVVGQLSPVLNASVVTLAQCTFTENGANPTPKVTAEEMTGEFAKDPKAAEKKYKQSEDVKEAIISGTVAGTESRPDGSFHTVILTGKDGNTVHCSVSKEVKDSLKAGDKVTMKGDLGLYDKDKKQLGVNTAFLLKKD